MPPHVHYVEAFAGSLAVLLAKPCEGVSEVVNDMHHDLTNFWQVLQGLDSFAAFQRLCEATPFSEDEWQSAELEFAEWPQLIEEATSRITRAWKFFVLCRQSMAGRMKGFAPLSRNRVRRGMNEQASAWLTCVEGLPEVHTRLKRVVVLNSPAVDVIRQQDGENTLIYADPPYPHETRATTDEYGAHEMSEADHRELLDTLSTVKGKFLLSGYDNPLYGDYEKRCGWNRHSFDLPNNAAGGKEKRRMVEVVWVNF